MMPVNYLAVFVAAISSMVVGSIWYGPLFGKMFMQESGMDKWSKEKQNEMKKNMWMSYVGQFVASLVMFYVLSGLVSGFYHMSLTGGMLTGLIVWIGFVVPVKLGDLLWGGTKKMFFLTTGNMLVTLLVAGAIIGMWK